jgi:hypothetical protein
MNFIVMWIIGLIFAAVDAAVAAWLLGGIFPNLHFGQWFLIVLVALGVLQSSHTLNELRG